MKINVKIHYGISEYKDKEKVLQIIREKDGQSHKKNKGQNGFRLFSSNTEHYKMKVQCL